MPNEGNIKASILLILLKCLFVGCSNGNESFTDSLFSNYGPLNMLFIFFDISFIVFLSKDFCQKVYEETIHFQFKFKKLIPRCSILNKIRMPNFVILKWRPFEYKVKSGKICPVFGAVFSEIKKCWYFEFSWIKYFGNDCWNYGPSNLKAELKVDSWLQIGIYSRKNCPRHISGQLPPANS